MYLTSTKFLVFSGTAVTGGVAVAGWAIYNALKEDVENTKKVMQDEEFWNSKIDTLEQELVRLHKEKPKKDNDLIQRIVGDVSKNAHFNLNNEGNAFINKDKTFTKRKELADFCRDNSKHSNLEEGLVKKLCDKDVSE